MSRPRRSRPSASGHRRLRQPERLEDRLVMDGAGFVNTDPPEDPGSIVGEAGIVANDDYASVATGAQSVRISPLENDLLPEGASGLTIKSVSDTAQGATVTISEDGRHLIYTAADEEGFRGWDSFYYIVQTEDGRLGKANVQLGRKGVSSSPGTSTNYGIYPSYKVLEDSAEQFLNVVQKYLKSSEYEGATIVSATTPEGGGTARISDDGLGLWYQPAYAFTGRDDVEITVRSGDGTEYDFRVCITVEKPYAINGTHDGVSVERGTGPITISPLGNDSRLRPFETPPYIESASVPEYAGTITPTSNGQGMVFSPAADFEGNVRVSYTIRYGEAEHQTVTGTLYVSVYDGFEAVENYFLVEPDSGSTVLDVLANDPVYWVKPYSLRIVEVSEGSAEGLVSHNGQSVSYQPLAGYEGDETFTYTVESSTGIRHTARVTVEVAPRPADPFGIAQFATRRELEQYLIDRAVQHYQGAFGHFVDKCAPLPEGVAYRAYFVTDAAVAMGGGGSSYSETNTQVEGVDEADIVETDGRFVYTLSRGKLAIVDLIDPSAPVLVSMTEFETSVDEMYLQGDRLTLIHKGSQASTYRSGIYSGYTQEVDKDLAVVQVLDISDRAAPTLLERTEIDGAITDSRAIGSKVHLVIQRQFEFPELGGHWVVEPELPGEDSIQTDPVTGERYLSSFGLGQRGLWANESLEQYLARVRDELVETGLATYTTYNAAGGVVASGLLTAPDDVHKPIGGEDTVVSLLTLDTADAVSGPAAGATSFITDNQTTVYVSTESAYVFAYDAVADITTISKLGLADDGTLPLVATGQIRGKLLNQFSADEYDGRLRVATTQQEREYYDNGRRWRQARLLNNLQVIEQHGSQLAVVGEVTNLAPTETIKSVRFMGERAYVVTFRVVDPLFAVDLSDPTSPVVRGAIKIPGFSDYLHPVGNNYLLGIGRDADEITGRLGPFQITLFDVSDLDNPTVADQVTFEGANWVSSEAWIDHHAVAFFEESGVLAVPLAWSESVTEVREDGTTYESYQQHEATWTFKVKTNGKAKLTATGKIEHPKPTTSGIITVNPLVASLQFNTDVWVPSLPAAPRTMQRALRIGNVLVTVSNDWLQTHKLHNPGNQVGEVHLGPPVADDRFDIEEDSGAHVLDVLANDPPAGGEPITIEGVGDVSGGTVEVAEDGRSVVFTPDADFFGYAGFTYTVDAPLFGEVSARVTVYVQGTPDDPTAVDDTFALDAAAGATELDVLANDLNPDYIGIGSPFSYSLVSIDTSLILLPDGYRGLTITEVGPTRSGAVVEINDAGVLVYTPAEGFIGIDTFAYAIEDRLGRTDTATVSVYVGVELPEAEPEPEAAPVTEAPPVEEPVVQPQQGPPRLVRPTQPETGPEPAIAPVTEAPPRVEAVSQPQQGPPRLVRPAVTLIAEDVVEALYGKPRLRPQHPTRLLATRAADAVPDDPATPWERLADRVHDGQPDREATPRQRPEERRDGAGSESVLAGGGVHERLVDRLLRRSLWE